MARKNRFSITSEQAKNLAKDISNYTEQQYASKAESIKKGYSGYQEADKRAAQKRAVNTNINTNLYATKPEKEKTRWEQYLEGLAQAQERSNSFITPAPKKTKTRAETTASLNKLRDEFSNADKENADIYNVLSRNNPAYLYANRYGETDDKGNLKAVGTGQSPVTLGAPSGWERIGRTFSGGAKDYASGVMGTAQAFAPDNMTIGQSAAWARNPNSQTYQEYERRLLNERDTRLLRNAMNLSDSASADLQRAKYGASDVGQFLVDVGSNAVQLAGDTAVNLATGGMGGMAALATRSFGSGRIEALKNGMSENKALLSGAKSAAIEVLTEKLFGAATGFAYGKGLIKNENLVKGIVNRLAKTDAGRTVLSMIFAANEEGLEEVASDLLNPIADRILQLDDGKGSIYKDTTIDQIVSDYLVGAALGLVGTGVNVANGTYTAENAQQRAYEQYQRQLVDTGLLADGEANALAQQYQPIVENSSRRGRRNLSQAETEKLQSALNGMTAENDISNIQGRIRDLGGTGDAVTAQAILKTANGEKLTKAERAAYKAFGKADRVVNEFNDTEGATANDWVYNEPASPTPNAELRQSVNNYGLTRANEVLRNGTSAARMQNKLAQNINVPLETVSRVYNLNPNVDPNAFESAFQAAYTMGQESANEAALSNVPTLTPAQASIAYSMGKSTITQNVEAPVANTVESNIEQNVETEFEPEAKPATVNVPATENIQEESNEVHLRQGSERNDGENTGRPVRELENSAGRDTSGQAKNKPEAETGNTEQTSGQVVINGVPQNIEIDDFATEETEAARKLAEENGKKVVFFRGGNIKDDNGNIAESIVDGDTWYIRTDGEYFPENYALHERTHEAIANGDVDIGNVLEALNNQFSEKELENIAQQYADATEMNGGQMTATKAFEEIICDAVADMNVFAGTGLKVEENYNRLIDSIRANVGEAKPSKPNNTLTEYSRYQGDLTKLRAENKRLKKQVEHWKNQTKPTKEKTVREADINKLARKVVDLVQPGNQDQYAWKLHSNDINQQLQELGNFVVNSEDLRFTDIHDKAEEIAEFAIEQSRVYTADEVTMAAAADIKSILNKGVILNNVSKSVLEDVRGRGLNIFGSSKKPDAIPLDVQWQQLTEEYGENFFPPDTLSHEDMLNIMADIVSRSKATANSVEAEAKENFSKAEQGYAYDLAVESLTNYIIDGILSEDVRQTAPTMRDKQDARLAKEKARGKERLENQKARDEEKRLKQKEHYEERLSNQAEKYETRLEKQAAKQKEHETNSLTRQHERDQRDAERRIRRAIRATRREVNRENKIKNYQDRIARDSKDLLTWLNSPDVKKGKYIPSVMQKQVADMLSSLDMFSNRYKETGEMTSKDLTDVASFYVKLSDFVENISVQQADRQYAMYDFPPEFNAQLSKYRQEIDRLSENFNGTLDITNMPLKDLENLSQTLKIVKNVVKNTNRLHQNAMYAHVNDAGQADVENLRQYQSKNTTTKAAQTVKSFVFWKYMRPAYVFERFGSGGRSIRDELIDGQNTMAYLASETENFFNEAVTEKEIKEWRKTVLHPEVNGETIDMTVPQLMALYELSKRPKAANHLNVGGFQVNNFAVKGVIHSNKAKLKNVDYKKLCEENLTERQREVADALQNYMATRGGEMGNYVTFRRWGINQFTEEHYFPMKVVGESLTDTSADAKPENVSMYALLNQSFTKGLDDDATQALALGDIFDIFQNHMLGMEQYRSFALPVLDTIKWYNYGTGEENSLREQLKRVFGADEHGNGNATQFIRNIIKAYNGTENYYDPYSNFAKRSLSRFNRAAVSFNGRVVIQQPLAITRAAMILNPKDLATSFANVKNNAKIVNEMLEHSGIAKWKSMGFYDLNVSRGLQERMTGASAGQKIADIGLKGAELADTYTWAAMWDASKKKVRRMGIAENDPNFFSQVNEVFNEVIYKTQVVDSIMTKNELSRSDNLFWRTVNSFMSEPATTASMVMEEIFDVKMDLAKGDKLAWRKHSGRLARVFTVYLAQSVLTAMAQSLYDAWRDDNDYASFMDKLIDKFFGSQFWNGNLAQNLNPLNWFTLASDVVDLAKWFGQQAGLDTYGYQPNSVWLQWADAVGKGIKYAVDVAKNGKESNYTWYSIAQAFTKGASQLTGIPAYNLMREATSAWNSIIGDALGNKDEKLHIYNPSAQNSIKYAWQDGYLGDDEAMEALQDADAMGDDVMDEDEAYFALKKWKTGDTSDYSSLFDALEGDGDVRKEVKDLQEHGKEDKNIKSTLTRKYKDEYIEAGNDRRAEIRKALYSTGLYDSANDVVEMCQKWLKDKK